MPLPRRDAVRKLLHLVAPHPGSHNDGIDLIYVVSLAHAAAPLKRSRQPLPPRVLDNIVALDTIHSDVIPQVVMSLSANDRAALACSCVALDGTLWAHGLVCYRLPTGSRLHPVP